MPSPANRMFLSDESDIAVMALPGSPFITTAGPSEPPPYNQTEKERFRTRGREMEKKGFERDGERKRQRDSESDRQRERQR